MFIRTEWQARGDIEEQTGRVRVQTGVVRWWLSAANGRGKLNIYYEARDRDSYFNTAKCTSLGVLGRIYGSLPAIAGQGTTLKATAMSQAWISASDAVLEFLSSVGLMAKVVDRSLEFRTTLAPAELIERVGVCFLALDTETRGALPEEAFNELRLSAVKLFEDPEPILHLLDSADCERRVAELLGKSRHGVQNRLQESAALSAVRKLNPKSIVQFHCGSGWFLNRIYQSALGSLAVVGIEPSIARAARAKLRIQGFGEVQHGSLVEPPREMRLRDFALLMQALPPAGDTRLERAADMLCGRLGFEWVLAVEDNANAAAACEFAAWCSQKFSYNKGTWQTGASGSAVLLRRSSSSPRRASPECGPGVRAIETRLFRKIQIQEEQWASTLEAFSLRTVDPKWLIYLPSGLASLQQDRSDGLLEHPGDAFNYYRDEGVFRVVVETKHMGSRAIVVICRNEDVAEARFGKRELGSIYTRNGRPFFDDPSTFLATLQEGLSRAHFWERFQTEWVCLDGEMLPWSVKAQRLISEDHREALGAAEAVVGEMERARAEIAPDLRDELAAKQDSLRRYRRLLDKYEGEIGSPISFAPFHLIAVEGRAFFDKNHLWHMQVLNALVKRAGKPFLETRYAALDVRSAERVARVLDWWKGISDSGEEGLVVKPLHFICQGRRGRAQPAIKCRGKEHLRLVYGPDYDSQENRMKLLDRPALARRRQKHRRILRQFALSIEAVERFLRKEELSRVAECVRGVLSLETREVFPDKQSL